MMILRTNIIICVRNLSTGVFLFMQSVDYFAYLPQRSTTNLFMTLFFVNIEMRNAFLSDDNTYKEIEATSSHYGQQIASTSRGKIRYNTWR